MNLVETVLFCMFCAAIAGWVLGSVLEMAMAVAR